MTIRRFVLALAAACAVSVAAHAADARKLNVLFIAVDDMNNDLACYGHPLVQSPNIDRLAKMGVRFEKAYCQFPLCSPSRSSVFTGLRPDSTRVFDLNYHFRQGLPDVVTLPQMFSANRYYAARVGKMYHYGNPGDIGTNSLDDRASWQERINPAGRDKTALERDIMNYTPKGGLGKSMSYLADKTGQPEEHTDGKVATETIKLLEKHKDEPFFIGCGFYKPHCPYVSPQKFFDLYPMDKITLPPITPATEKEYPAPSMMGCRPWPYQGVSADQARECKQGYYAAISFVDSQIGRVLDAVERLGLSQNTIIVFWSDHGYHLGEHGLWHKESVFEEASRVPLIIVMPDRKSAGTVSARTVELVDLYPSLAELTGVTPPKNLEGFSLVPLLQDPKAEWSHAAYTQEQRGMYPGYSVRTEKWRYTEWDGGAKGSELYDHESDPHELTNLAADAKYAETVTQMKALVKQMHPTVVKAGEKDPKAKEKFSN